MYYKVINKESEVYKKLREQRAKELAADERNKAKIEELLGFKWKTFLGLRGYQNLFRVDIYKAFIPEDGAVISNAVRESKDKDGFYYPNRRTKAGKALDEFLRYKQETFRYDEVLEILGCEKLYGNFIVPFMEVINDVVLIYLDNRHIPKPDDVIEITSKEFKELLKGAIKK